jgi:hypothetical protein
MPFAAGPPRIWWQTENDPGVAAQGAPRGRGTGEAPISGATEMFAVRARTGPMAGATVTRYDASH